MTPLWNPDLVAQLVSAGCNARAISVVFGLSKNAVLGRLHRDRDLNKLWTDMVAAQRPPKKYKPKPKHRASPPPGLTDPPKLGFVTGDWKNWEEREGKKRAVEVKAQVKKPHMLLVPQMNLGPHQCKWPEVTDPTVTGGYLFCGAPTGAFETYCKFHKARSLAKGGTA
jgi:hypothetical protein